MKKIYLDHASTSFPKPPCVVENMINYMQHVGSNISRSSYESAFSALEVVYETRLQLAKLFDFPHAKNVIFTQNITSALNFILKGWLKSGDHVLVSALEHNAVMRPLVQMEKLGVTFSRIPCDNVGELNIHEIEYLIQQNTKAIIITGASNVCGTMMPLEKIGEICQKHQLKFIVDTAQLAGFAPISMKKMYIDALAFTGHKGLLGPQGIGGFICTDEMAEEIDSLIVGGTGSQSDREETPTFLPDKFEAGTLNIPGIYGLHASLQYLEEIGIQFIQQKELALTKYFIEALQSIDSIKIIGKTTTLNRTAVVSIQCQTMDVAMLSQQLSEQYQIMTRVGLHCAPNAHKTLGTFPHGTIRFSFGHTNTMEEIEITIAGIKNILQA